MRPISNVKTPCRFCGFTIWVPADCKEPECEDCEELHNAALDTSLEVEQTLEPITEWKRQSEYQSRGGRL